jgi:hypothetical protein
MLRRVDKVEKAEDVTRQDLLTVQNTGTHPNSKTIGELKKRKLATTRLDIHELSRSLNLNLTVFFSNVARARIFPSPKDQNSQQQSPKSRRI